jgi:succinate-acetate transporter protein
MAAIIIILLSIIATIVHMVVGEGRNLDAEIQFGTTVLNACSLFWLCLVLGVNEKKTHEKFGEAVRREMPTLLLALFISFSYSAISLVSMLFPIG